MRGEATMRPGEATLTDVAPQGIITEMAAGKEVRSDLVKSCFLFNAGPGSFFFIESFVTFSFFSKDKIRRGRLIEPEQSGRLLNAWKHVG
jgi:hypothetical protein